MFHVPEKYRVKEGYFKSGDQDGNNGAFIVPMSHGTISAFCIASDGMGYEHVSVTLSHKKKLIKRCPTWEEMCVIKGLFWDDEDCAVQYHPPKSEHVNNHPYCLHLWRPIGIEFPVPDKIMVGIWT